MEVDQPHEDVDMGVDAVSKDGEKMGNNNHQLQHDTAKDGLLETSNVTPTAKVDTPLGSLLTTSASITTSASVTTSVSAGSEQAIPFLTGPILTYLRGVSAGDAWQNLVAEYLAFEREGPAIGVSSI